MHKAFGRLARNPKRGTDSANVRPGYFRYRYRSHVVFYKTTADGILIVRVLHAQMNSSATFERAVYRLKDDP